MRLLFLIALAWLLAGCDIFSPEEKDKIDNGFKIKTIKEIKPSQWESGVFYQAFEETGLHVSSTSDVTSLLAQEISNGVPIQFAWYVENKSSCATPHGIAFEVIVPATVIIQLTGKTGKEPSAVFKPVKNQPHLICPYFVIKLAPKK